jgi:hypothetical protein
MIAVVFAGGIVGHIVLGFACLIFNVSHSAKAMYAFDIACVSVAFLVARFGSKLLGPQAYRSFAAV